MNRVGMFSRLGRAPAREVDAVSSRQHTHFTMHK